MATTGREVPTYRYAAYGSNLHPDRLRRRVGSAALCGTARVASFDLLFHKTGMDGSAKCGIVPGRRGIFVAVYEIAEQERVLLDRCEGLGIGYHQAFIEVEGFGRCATYIAAAAAVDHRLSPFDWYKAYVICGARHHGFPDDYIAALESVSTCCDHDPARARQEWTAVRRIMADA